MLTLSPREEKSNGDKISLADRYRRRDGRILISGVQALVRLMLLQAERDARAGLKTGGYVSGYRGSPLGTLDSAFASAADLVKAAGIVVQPAVNEELAATAVAGTQQIDQTEGARVDGVFALWYGKGPGLDRASDAIRHGNYQSASAKGGVVLAVGDDHVAKSSSIVCYSDVVVAGLQVPLFYPADPREIVEFGLHAFALSRHTGSWTALKILTDVADSTRTVATGEIDISPVLPPIVAPPGGLYNRWPEMPLEQENRLVHRLPDIAAYVRANGLDRAEHRGPNARIGLLAAGKSWYDLKEALSILGLSPGRLEALGVALYKPALIWPLEAEGLCAFATGLKSLVVVEEKGGFIERQVKELLYGRPSVPGIYGKQGPEGAALLPATGDLTPEIIAAGIGPILSAALGDSLLASAVSAASGLMIEQGRWQAAPAARRPFFCSGCPHNRSTVLPDGSRALSGIGCHGLAAYNQPRHGTSSQMGGEGIHWVGLSHFTDEAHVFANMGDGTYFHSGLLAIRQAVAARANITYKLLYNSAVAMTGGQPVDGELDVGILVEQIAAEGVATIMLATDDPARYPAGHRVRAKVSKVVDRRDLDALQRELREMPGVGVIVYEQMCATEKRRLRKRGKLEDPARRVFINTAVCEGCGDCSVKSNCLSVEPVKTAFGVKRRINQSSCNKDYSCIEGFCPSFVTVEGATPRKALADRPNPALLPSLAPAGAKRQRVVVTGVGGTGVVTIGALVVMAAHISGRNAGVLDQVGMAQKGGGVTSHLHLAAPDEPIHALRVTVGKADLVLGCDLVVGNMRDVIAAIDNGRTFVVLNADVAITGDFTRNKDAMPDTALLLDRIRRRAGRDHVVAHPFTRLAERLLGDAIGSNLMMLGLARQKGWIDLDEAALDEAITLNGVAGDMNRAAFTWGRWLAHDPDRVMAAAGLGEPAVELLAGTLDRFGTFLADYQDQAYAERFQATVARVRAAETAVGAGEALTEAAARSLFKLMAYKDEYEVARLYANAAFSGALAEQFEGRPRLSFHLAPPLLARRDPMTGHPRKMRFGGWILPVFRVLARMRGLRHTPFDPFGYTAERRMERGMIAEWEAVLGEIASGLTRENHARAVQLAQAPLAVRGYGHIKAQAAAAYQAELRRGLADWRTAGEEAGDIRQVPVRLRFGVERSVRSHSTSRTGKWWPERTDASDHDGKGGKR